MQSLGYAFVALRAAYTVPNMQSLGYALVALRAAYTALNMQSLGYAFMAPSGRIHAAKHIRGFRLGIHTR